VFFFQAEDGIRDDLVTGVQTCALPISSSRMPAPVTLVGRSLSIEDVVAVARLGAHVGIAPRALDAVRASRRTVEGAIARGATMRSEERRVGKEGRDGGWASH